MSTRTSLGLSTIPRTRCSPASTTTVLIAAARCPALVGGLLSRGLLLRFRRLGGGTAVGGGQCGVEQLELAGLLGLDLQGALGTRQTLELLPVTGDLQQLEDGLGGLSSHGEPVLGAFGVDLDQARLFLGVVAADDLDR